MSFVDVNDVKLHYQLIGQGEVAVVFLHGLVMDNLSSWFFTLANQSSQITKTLLYDLRGHGFSDRPKTNYSIDQHVEDLKVLFQKIEITKPVVLVGNSFGGLLAINFAKKYPKLVHSLVLVDAQVNDAEWKAMMLRSLSLQGDEANAAIGQNFQNWLGRNSSRKSNRLAKNAHELLHETSMIQDIEKEVLLTDTELTQIKTPAYAIYGANSDIIHVANRLKTFMPHLTLNVFDGCTHSVLWEKTEEVKACILERIKASQSEVSLNG